MHTPTLAGLKRALTPGTRLRITNHVRPVANRDTRVHDKTNTAALATWSPPSRDQGSEPIPSFLRWPAAANIRGDVNPNVYHIDREGIPFLTLEVIPDDHDEAPYWPAKMRSAS